MKNLEILDNKYVWETYKKNIKKFKKELDKKGEYLFDDNLPYDKEIKNKKDFDVLFNKFKLSVKENEITKINDFILNMINNHPITFAISLKEHLCYTLYTRDYSNMKLNDMELLITTMLFAKYGCEFMIKNKMLLKADNINNEKFLIDLKNMEYLYKNHNMYPYLTALENNDFYEGTVRELFNIDQNSNIYNYMQYVLKARELSNSKCLQNLL